jgi:hypothetical protein
MAIGSAWVMGAPGLVLAGLNVLTLFWWILPLSASLASLSFLMTTSALKQVHRGTYPAAILTPAYLVPGPSMAALNLSSLLFSGISPPAWVGYVMLLSLCCSALFYLDVIKDADQTEREGSKQEPPFAFLGNL